MPKRRTAAPPLDHTKRSGYGPPRRKPPMRKVSKRGAYRKNQKEILSTSAPLL